MVASTWITPGRVQFLKNKKRFHTAWVWVIPLLVGQLILRPYLYSEHTGCERTRDAFDNTRTT